MDRQEALEIITPYVVKVVTQQGFGTGFLLAYSQNRSIAGIATSAHVVNTAEIWEQPIRIEHHTSKSSKLLHASINERRIIINEKKDTALILFYADGISFPKEPLDLLQENEYIKQGTFLSWLGYPQIAPQNLCYFGGLISCFLPDDEAYLVDGVVINGVSGSPAFIVDNIGIGIAGMVSAYIPNRVGADTLPGLGFLRTVSHLQEHIFDITSLDEPVELDPEESASGPTVPSTNDENNPASV